MSTARIPFQTASLRSSSSLDREPSYDWDAIETLAIVNPDTGTWTCPGIAPSRGRRCQWTVDPGNQVRAMRLLQSLPEQVRSTSNVEGWLRQIATLLLCNISRHQNPHINQLDGVVENWQTAILSLGSSPNRAASSSGIPTTRRSRPSYYSAEDSDHSERITRLEDNMEEIRNILQNMMKMLQNMMKTQQQQERRNGGQRTTVRQGQEEREEQERKQERQEQEERERCEEQRRDAEALPQTQPQFKSKSPCEKLSPAKTTLFNTEPLPKTQFVFTAQPPFKIEPLSKTGPLFRTEPLPKTQFLFTVQPPFKIEPLSQTGPLFKTDSLFRTEPLPKSELVREEVSALETTPVKELPPEQIPLPPSSLVQPTTFPQDTLSSQETKPGLRTGTEETSAIDIITNSDTNTVVDTSSNLKINSLVSPWAPASLLATTLPSATPSEDIPPQANTHPSIDTTTTTNSPPLNFSDPSSEPNPSDSSATSASLRTKAELAPYPLATPVTEILEALLTLSTDEQEELAETLTSITQRQQNAEGDGQVEAESELLRCDGQTYEEEMKSHNQDESTATEKEMGTAKGWDEEATLVEDQTSRSLEKAALKNADGFSNDISTRKANGVLKCLDGLKVLESEAPPAVEVVAHLHPNHYRNPNYNGSFIQEPSFILTIVVTCVDQIVKNKFQKQLTLEISKTGWRNYRVHVTCMSATFLWGLYSDHVPDP